jgi:hypothetical protein
VTEVEAVNQGFRNSIMTGGETKNKLLRIFQVIDSTYFNGKLMYLMATGQNNCKQLNVG